MLEPSGKITRKTVIVLISIFILIDSFAVFVASESTAVVNTTTGPVQGEILKTFLNSVEYATFKGIRFAKAPVGYLRFKPPVPVDPWTETLNATVDGNECPQLDPSNKFIGSEDCLFLSVNTPVTKLDETPTELKSVMIFIYGGAYIVNDSPSDMFRPDYLLEKDVIVAYLTYRLGALGFLALSHPNATGNAGLKDQNLALKWIKANIEKFGGNPKNITIFGQSAGGASVGFHVLSDASVGLFQAAISMSGVPMNPWAFQAPSKAFLHAQKLGALIGTYSSSKEVLLKTFYNASAEELVQVTAALSRFNPLFTPTIEDESITSDAFLTTCSVDKYVNRNFSHVPQILGYMDQEALSLIPQQSLTEIITLAVNDAEEIGLSLPKVLQEVFNSSGNSTEFLEETIYEAVVNETSNLRFIAQIDQTQKLLAANNNDKPVYYYHDSFYANGSLHYLRNNVTLQGPAHADDLAYVFYVPFANYSTDPNDPVARTIQRVTTMWTNFAKYGNPTPNWVGDNSLNITWPDSGPSGLSLDIGTELTVGPRPVSKNTELIELLSEPELRLKNGCYS